MTSQTGAGHRVWWEVDHRDSPVCPGVVLGESPGLSRGVANGNNEGMEKTMAQYAKLRCGKSRFVLSLLDRVAPGADGVTPSVHEVICDDWFS